MGGGIVAYAEGGESLLSSFTAAFSDVWQLIVSNPALAIIVGAAVGIPLVGGILSIFRGR